MSKDIKEPMEGELLPKRGAPTKYESWMPEKVIELYQKGAHVSAICRELGIDSRDTFYRWLKEYPEFGAAYKTAKEYGQAFYEDIGLAGTLGQIKNFNFSAWAMIMNNKFGHEYKRNATGSNTEINIGSINSIEKLDSTQLDHKIKELNEKLGLDHKGQDDRQDRTEEGTSDTSSREG